MNANWIGHILRMNGLAQRIIEIKIEGTGSRGRRSKQLLNNLKESERGNSILHCVNNSLWKSLWSCRKTNCCLIMIFADLASVVCMFHDNIYLNSLERSSFGVAYSDFMFILNSIETHLLSKQFLAFYGI